MIANQSVYSVMPWALDYDGLLCVWNLLGAYNILSDIRLAMQTHALERQFNNWIFHVLLHDKLGEYFETVQFYNFPAHPELTGRLHEALALLRLRCVNRKLWRHCTYVSERSGIVLHEFVCASRPVHSLDPIITNAPRCVMGSAMDDIGMVFERVRVALEKQHEFARGSEEQTGNRTDSVRSLENNLGELYSKNAALGAKIFEHELSHWYAEWNHRY